MNKKIVLLGTLTLCITTASLAMDNDWELLSNCEEKKKKIQRHNNLDDEGWEKLDFALTNPNPRRKQTTLKNLKKKKTRKKTLKKYGNNGDDTNSGFTNPIAKNKKSWSCFCQKIIELLLCLNCK